MIIFLRPFPSKYIIKIPRTWHKKTIFISFLCHVDFSLSLCSISASSSFYEFFGFSDRQNTHARQLRCSILRCNCLINFGQLRWIIEVQRPEKREREVIYSVMNQANEIFPRKQNNFACFLNWLQSDTWKLSLPSRNSSSCPLRFSFASGFSDSYDDGSINHFQFERRG